MRRLIQWLPWILVAVSFVSMAGGLTMTIRGWMTVEEARAELDEYRAHVQDAITQTNKCTNLIQQMQVALTGPIQPKVFYVLSNEVPSLFDLKAQIAHR